MFKFGQGSYQKALLHLSLVQIILHPWFLISIWPGVIPMGLNASYYDMGSFSL